MPKYLVYRKTLGLGGSIAVTLPTDFIKQEKIEQGQVIVAIVDGCECSFMTITGLANREQKKRPAEAERRKALEQLKLKLSGKGSKDEKEKEESRHAA